MQLLNKKLLIIIVYCFYHKNKNNNLIRIYIIIYTTILHLLSYYRRLFGMIPVADALDHDEVVVQYYSAKLTYDNPPSLDR